MTPSIELVGRAVRRRRFSERHVPERHAAERHISERNGHLSAPEPIELHGWRTTACSTALDGVELVGRPDGLHIVLLGPGAHCRTKIDLLPTGEVRCGSAAAPAPMVIEDGCARPLGGPTTAGTVAAAISPGTAVVAFSAGFLDAVPASDVARLPELLREGAAGCDVLAAYRPALSRSDVADAAIVVAWRM